MKKKQRILYKKIAVVILLLLCVLLVRAVVSGVESLSVIKEKREVQKRVFDSKESRIGQLESELAFLETQEGLEQEMIATLPIKRPGETVTILIEREEEEVRFLERKEESSPWWQFWK